MENTRLFLTVTFPKVPTCGIFEIVDLSNMIALSQNDESEPFL